ncbi:MAG: sensor histidine kinase [Sphingopyxis sp.]|nr:sensor histidine kinase [Sphingopyxis sp.]
MITAVRARISPDGHLLSADSAIAQLHMAAGGFLGGPTMLPALARLAALAQRLQTPIERPVLLAGADHDVRAHARFLPDGEGVRIELSDWTETDAVAVEDDAPLPPIPRRVIPPGVVRWASDVRLRLVMVEADPLWGLGNIDWIGRSLSELFHLSPDREGKFALLTALAEQGSCLNQQARIALGSAMGTIVVMAARPMVDGDQFTGFIGEAAPIGFGQLPADVANPAQSALPTNLLGQLDTRSFALRIDGALRRPLGRIVANAETIAQQLQGPIRSDYARYASDIALAGRHLLDLVDDLADLQAVERDNFTIASEQVDLADVARRAAGLLAMKARERDVRIDPPANGEHALAMGEFRRVLQILLNLVGNAVRYGPDGGQVWVRVDEEPGWATITIADQGQGIGPDDQARLFTKFERLGRTDAGGSGLGLYISQRLARAMGGEITVDSAPGQGARFTLRLPAYAADS